MERLDVVVAGAGVVGLAVARELALAGREVAVVEKEAAIGTGASSRNSEVVHAGIYYQTGSLKARLCRRGRDLLYPHCEERGIPHRRIGKVIFARSEAEVENLRALFTRGRANGVEDLAWMTGAEARGKEPALDCAAALWSPSTGILDSHRLMASLREEAEGAGAVVVLGTPVLGGEAGGEGLTLRLGGREPMAARCRSFVNCAGLSAPALARSLDGLPPRAVPRGRLCKGNYFTFSGPVPFRHLVYPVPSEAGLGIHLTFDLAGQARFGPDVEWLPEGPAVGPAGRAAEPDYRVDPSRRGAFEEAVRRYWPGLPEGALQPGYAGVRAKVTGPGEPAADFLIEGEREHGVPGLVNLFGIESPGLTSCLALAEEVRRILESA